MMRDTQLDGLSPNLKRSTQNSIAIYVFCSSQASCSNGAAKMQLRRVLSVPYA
jgi:hypothetical protein